MSRKTTTKREATANFHKRRRTRQRSLQQSSNSNSCSTPATAATTTRTTTAATKTIANSRRSYPNLSRTGAYLTLLLLTTTCSLCAIASASSSGSGTSSTTAASTISSASSASASVASSFAMRNSPCEPQHWWDSIQGRCRPCTRCQGQTIPLRPCQLHIDTVCGSIYDLNIDWVVLAKTEPNWKEVSNAPHILPLTD